MNLIAEVNEQERQVQLGAPDAEFEAVIDGRIYVISARRVAAHVYLIVWNGKVFECLVTPDVASSGPRRPTQQHVHVHGHDIHVTIRNPRALLDTRPAALASNGPTRVLAPMPGKVVRLLAQTGTDLNAGAGILVVEAMKMQNEIGAPRAGILKQLRVAVGDTVNGGDLLAVIE